MRHNIPGPYRAAEWGGHLRATKRTPRSILGRGRKTSACGTSTFIPWTNLLQARFIVNCRGPAARNPAGPPTPRSGSPLAVKRGPVIACLSAIGRCDISNRPLGPSPYRRSQQISFVALTGPPGGARPLYRVSRARPINSCRERPETPRHLGHWRLPLTN